MPENPSPYTSPSPPAPLGSRPEIGLSGDTVFWGLLTTQFLGAFNDNYFKQMVLLKCTDLATTAKYDLQPLAMAAFALPFVLLSGLGGYISDRYSKRAVVILCKVLEIVVMLAALQVLLMSGVTAKAQLQLLILVLALMGAQSAIFGPAKYGILPELFSSKKLLPVNGAIQMTTFMAIIFGMAGAGIALDRLGNSLWLCSLIAVGIAVVGTATSFLIRPTPVADSGLKLQAGNLFVPRDVRELFRTDTRLLKAILVMMMFWFIGGVAQPAVNSLGENVLHLSKTRTSMLAASIGVGIAIGCVIAGFVNRGSNSGGARWTTQGSWMIVGSLLLITLLGSGLAGRPQESAGVPELFSSKKLLPVNGAIQMTTFMAIIFGMAGAGIALDRLGNSLWLCSLIAVGIAVVGTATSFLIRPTPVADSGLKLQAGNLFVPRDVRELFRTDTRLLKAILVMMMFWFIGGVAQPAVNSLGENVLHLSKTRTSMLAASIGVGIAIGCVIAGFVNRGSNSGGARWTTQGSWMIVGSLLLITLLGSGLAGRPQESAGVPESIWQCLLQADSVEWMLRIGMLMLGVSAGVFVVPIQVFIQQAPPAEQKGRLIGAMNFITWIGILLSAGYLAVMNVALARLSPEGRSHEYQFLVFLSLALLMVPVATRYRLPVAGQVASSSE